MNPVTKKLTISEKLGYPLQDCLRRITAPHHGTNRISCPNGASFFRMRTGHSRYRADRQAGEGYEQALYY